MFGDVAGNICLALMEGGDGGRMLFQNFKMELEGEAADLLTKRIKALNGREHSLKSVFVHTLRYVKVRQCRLRPVFSSLCPLLSLPSHLSALASLCALICALCSRFSPLSPCRKRLLSALKNYDKLLSNFDFNFNLLLYSKEEALKEVSKVRRCVLNRRNWS